MAFKTKAELLNDINFHKAAKEKLQTAYLALAEGGVQSYSIGSRSLTKYDLETIQSEIAKHDKAIAELGAALYNKSRRKAVGIVPRDW